jgi:hypothetical protein
MTIQRQYSLPNCKLILEGVSDNSTAANGVAGRPLVGILTNAECHFTGQETPIAGGREFLESLVTAVSDYAQECLSGIPHPAAHAGRGNRSGLVQFQKLDENLHRLIVHAQGANGSSGNGHAAPSAQIDLRTVQLFDLVEAVDQFLADSQTLPDLTLNLQPASKRNVVAREPVSKRALPAALGVSSLAVAAIALFFVPIPERRPEPASQSSTTEESSGTTPATSGLVESPAGNPPDRELVSPDADSEDGDSEEIDTTTNSLAAGSDELNVTSDDAAIAASGEEASEEASEEDGSADGSSPLSPEEIRELLNTSPEITDPESVDRLNRDLRDQLADAWAEMPDSDFDEDLIYRVAVADNGDILGFRYGNDAALEYVNETPLLDLRYNPVETESGSEPLAQFRVVFTPAGVVEVSPWHGRIRSPEPEN